VESPVTWIYGLHDKWMIPDEIRDIMSIAASGKRELIEIPTAHNLRTSDDAIASFQLISDAILRQIRLKEVPPVSPDKEELLDLLTRERERVIEGRLSTPNATGKVIWGRKHKAMRVMTSISGLLNSASSFRWKLHCWIPKPENP
jgi:hypothetical protein